MSNTAATITPNVSTVDGVEVPTPTARSIGRAAAETLTPVSFELGGKSPFIVLADADEAIAVANDQDYGLAATLCGRDEQRTAYVADRLVAGTVWVNCYHVRELAAPFGGSRNSGIGREGGACSFDFFCDVKNVATRHDSLISSTPTGA